MPENHVYSGRQKLAAALAAMTAALWLSSEALRALFAPVVYLRDLSLLDNGYFAANTRFTANLEKRSIPPQLPGPLDTWAGGAPKEIELGVPFFSRATLSIFLVDSHDSAPPVLEITTDGASPIRIATPKGKGKEAGKWTEEGKRSHLEVTLPKGDGPPPRKIVIRSMEGSWAALDRIEVRAAPKPAWYAPLFILAILAFYSLRLAGGDPLVKAVSAYVKTALVAAGDALAPVVASPGRMALVAFAIGFAALAVERESLVPYGATPADRYYLLGGDEPEYMLGAYSLAHDMDLNLYNDIGSGIGKTLFNLENYPHPLYGTLAHFRNFAPAMAKASEEEWKDRQMLIHRPGLSALIAPASLAPEKMRWWAYFIVSLATCALFAAALAALAQEGPARGTVFLAGMAMFLAPPTLFYGNQAFPDPVFPLMETLAAALLMRPTPARTMAAALIVALAPWFSDRAIPAGAVLAAGALILAPGTRWRLAVAGILLAGAAPLINYYMGRFGVPYPMYHGVRSPVTLLSAPKGAITTLLGVDRGILFQAPVFALAVAGLWSWWRSGERRIQCGMVGLSLLLTFGLIAGAYPDNTGGVGPAGRFNLSLVWLSFPALAMWIHGGVGARGWWILGSFLAWGLCQSFLLTGEPWRWIFQSHPMFTFRWAADQSVWFPDLSAFDGLSLTKAAVWGSFFAAAAYMAFAPRRG